MESSKHGHDHEHGVYSQHNHDHCHSHHHGDDVFAHRSKEYDTLEHECRAKTIAQQIVHNAPIPINKDTNMMDFGAGTGLLTQSLADHAGHITAVDVSPAMLDIFRSKSFACDPSTIQADLVENDALLNGATFDCIVSSMALHHVNNLPALFERLAKWTVPNGFIALADLDKEDGSFHDNQHMPGVFHHGHDRKELEELATKSGFQDVVFHTVDVIKKDQGEYPIFLMTAMRSA